MNHQGKRIALIGISPDIAENGGLNTFPSYGVRRIQAAVVADPALFDAEVMLIDERSAPAEKFIERILRFEPDVLGLSVYIWSTELLTQVAREVKRTLPDCTIVFGGPSARTQMFELEPFADYADYLDAVVVASDGEEIFREIVALTDRSRESLRSIHGLAIPGSAGWVLSPPRTPDPDMDTIASPFQEGLMPRQHVAYVETFRGCPLSCSFCQWGVMDSKRRFSVDYLRRELQAMKDTDAAYVFLVDAALNLNAAAFRNLVAAEKEVGFFSATPLLCEVYPTLLKSEHLDFLERTKWVEIGLGVQSLDPTTLDAISRPFKPAQLKPVIAQLSKFGLVDAELILGLPGDTPESFRRTLEEALTWPCNVRVYRCLILPDALMTRAPKEFDIRFDPLTLQMSSCHTWSEKQLRETQDYVTELAAATPNGYTGEYWWHFVSALPEYQHAYELPANTLS
jgi:radical SAM superfamily enzyme YgiQ (UPF0313 family)